MGRYIEEDENGNRYIVDDGIEAAPSRPPPFAAGADPLGPNYNNSYLDVAGEAITEIPQAVTQLGEDAIDVFSPMNTSGEWQVPVASAMHRAGAEKTLETVGGLSAGTAGAAALAPWGAGWGSYFGPYGTIAGGVLGGAAGFAGGMLGFDVAKDAGSELVTGEEHLRPVSQYMKDLVYNSTQGAVMGGGVEAMRIPYKGARGVAESYLRPNVEGQVAQGLKELEPDILAKIDEALVAAELDPLSPGKSLGEIVGSDALKNAERTIAMSDPSRYSTYAEAKRNRAGSQLSYLDDIETSQVAPDDVQAAVRTGVENDLGAMQREIDYARGDVESAVAELPLPIEAAEAGNLGREGVSAGREAIKGEVRSEFGGIGQGVVDPTPIKMAGAAGTAEYFKKLGEQPSGELASFMQQLSKEAEPSGLLDATGKPIVREPTYTMQDMQNYRSQAIEISKGSDNRSAAVANKIIDAIDESVENAIQAGTVTAQEAGSWRAGIAKRRLQGEIFENKGLPSKSVLAKEYSGAYTVPDSSVPGRYFKPGNRGAKEAMRNYKDAYGVTEAALEPIYRYATDSFRKVAVGEDGLVNAKKARQWLEQHGDALSEIPDLKEMLEKPESAQRFLNEKFEDLKRTTQDVQNGALKFWLKDIEPQIAIREMLSGKDVLRKVKATTEYLKSKDPDAVAGLRRGIIEHLQEKTFIPEKQGGVKSSIAEGTPFEGEVRAGMFAQEWNKLRPTLEKSNLFTKAQLKGFDTLYNDIKSASSVGKAKVAGDSGTAGNLSTLAALKRMAGGAFLKRIPGGTFAANILEPILRKMPEAQFRAKMQEALLNPRLARDLLNKANEKNIARSAKTIFAQEFDKAFGETTPGAAAITGAQVAAPFAPTMEKEKKKVIPNQNQVTARKSFPNPRELMTPVAPGKLTKKTVTDIVSQQSPETRARISVESSGDPFAVSKKGAQGLSQLMPGTAQDIAADLGEVYTPLSEGMTPEQQMASIKQNIRFGNHYFNQQLERFKDPRLAWAAYNAGPERVKQAIRLAGTSNPNRVLSNLPKGVQKETVPYVTEIMGRLGMG